MLDAFRIALGQLNQSVGDIGANADSILAARREARDADLVVFPELHLIGYPPEDLVLKPALVEKAAAQLERLAEASGDDGPAMLVGSAFVRDGALHNGVALLDQGRIAAVRFKHELPNYGTFDEMRLFQPGPLPEPVILRGTMIGVPICEDIWRPDVCRHLADFGAEMFICINGSPYEINKEALRIEGIARRRAGDTGIPLAYLNRVGGQDELVFDGGSFVVNGDGQLAARARDWEEQVLQTSWTRTARGWRCDRGDLAQETPQPETIYCAMVLALRDFVERSACEGVVVGLDGARDSALVAALAVDALGPECVTLALVPPLAGGAQALDDARACADSLGARCREITLDSRIAEALEALDVCFVGPEREAGERLAARMRALVLGAFAESQGAMLLSSATKSDFSLGRAPSCASATGGYSPLKDAYATTVATLATWRNGAIPHIGLGPEGTIFTASILARTPPLPDGVDDAGRLDAMLFGLVEHDKSIDQMVADGFPRAVLRQIEERLHASEALRRQSPPGVKLSPRNFGRDRRYPITHAFRS
ncbi:NAD+ synthase [Novosphingobium decolorationis]|uniref:Glutamine-dependent NAD(+) synthetase n=1 Tax=Novosphingobium decolorationis TaxID=2698673 RepID=A0ABX8EAE8_9SPHN|nr:NAD+ synthase [Novosphingobium decolorationis]QVM85011.1 NAD+ synthase [Novosphingobium decolorationis]